jgi:hypothetical protein
MKDWNVYEVLALIAPGSVILTSWALLHPGVGKAIFDTDLSVGAFGLFALVSYVVGNLVQAVANLVEKQYWKIRGGWPTDKGTLLKRGVLAACDIPLLEAKVMQAGLSPANSIGLMTECDAKTWDGLKSRILAWLKARNLASRIDTFNAQYGLNRGLAVALFVCGALVLLYQGIPLWRTELILLLVAGACLFRMERFGHHYARELYSQFIAAPMVQEDSAHPEIT